MLLEPLSLLVSQMRKENEALEKQETSLLALLLVSLSLLACLYSLRISWGDICPKCLKRGAHAR